MSWRVPAALAVSFALSACAAFSPQAGRALPGPPFDLSGRVLVSADGRAFSSGMRWRHDSGEDELWLMSPLGQALAHIRARPGNATLTATDQQAYHASSVESLTRRALGWELPLSHMQYWVQGQAAAADPAQATARDARGRLVALDQAGWHVHIEYPEAPEQSGQPRRLELTRGEQKIRLVIDEWRRDETSP
jgi:outer membrane lipoprotein LolB